MGIVTDYLRNLVTGQIEEQKLVIWFDPERHYVDFAQALAMPNTTVAIYY